MPKTSCAPAPSSSGKKLTAPKRRPPYGDYIVGGTLVLAGMGLFLARTAIAEALWDDETVGQLAYASIVLAALGVMLLWSGWKSHCRPSRADGVQFSPDAKFLPHPKQFRTPHVRSNRAPMPAKMILGILMLIGGVVGVLVGIGVLITAISHSPNISFSEAIMAGKDHWVVKREIYPWILMVGWMGLFFSVLLITGGLMLMVFGRTRSASLPPAFPPMPDAEAGPPPYRGRGS